MQPWMLIAMLLAGCLALLLVAPRVHRRSLERAQTHARRDRQRRIEELRAGPGSHETEVPDAEFAVRARHVLLLRGVRAEIATAEGRTLLVHSSDDSEAVGAVIGELARTEE